MRSSAITTSGTTGRCSAIGQGPTIARRALEAAGIPVYENDVVRLTKDGQPFWLAGLGDQLAYLAGAALRPVRRIGVDDLARRSPRSPTMRR